MEYNEIIELIDSSVEDAKTELTADFECRLKELEDNIQELRDDE